MPELPQYVAAFALHGSQQITAVIDYTPVRVRGRHDTGGWRITLYGTSDFQRGGAWSERKRPDGTPVLPWARRRARDHGATLLCYPKPLQPGSGIVAE